MVLYHAPNQRSLSLPYWGRGWMGQWQACSGPCGACESTRNVLVDCHIAPPCSQYTARQSMKNYFCFLVLLIFLRGAISALLQGTGHLLQTGEHYVHVRFLAARRGVQHTQQRLILRADDAHVQRAVFVWEIPSRLQPTLEVALREPTLWHQARIRVDRFFLPPSLRSGHLVLRSTCARTKTLPHVASSLHPTLRRSSTRCTGPLTSSPCPSLSPPADCGAATTASHWPPRATRAPRHNN